VSRLFVVHLNVVAAAMPKSSTVNGKPGELTSCFASAPLSWVDVVGDTGEPLSPLSSPTSFDSCTAMSNVHILVKENENFEFCKMEKKGASFLFRVEDRAKQRRSPVS
jgi:hypothetical protein